jgi:hypothetical protein
VSLPVYTTYLKFVHEGLTFSGISVIPAGAIQISSGQGDGMHTLTMTNATSAGGAIVQYAQGQEGQQFFVPGKPLHEQ